MPDFFIRNRTALLIVAVAVLVGWLTQGGVHFPGRHSGPGESVVAPALAACEAAMPSHLPPQTNTASMGYRDTKVDRYRNGELELSGIATDGDRIDHDFTCVVDTYRSNLVLTILVN